MKHKFLVLLALSAAVSSVALAVPEKHPKCAESKPFRDVPGGSGAYFNANCTVLYVLPPQAHSLEIAGYKSSNEIARRCERLRLLENEIVDLEHISVNETKRLKQLSDKRMKMEENLELGLVPVGETVDSIQAKMEKIQEDMDKLRERISKYQREANEKKLAFAREPAGRGQFVMATAWAEIQKAYEKANPGVRVVPMPIDQAFLSINEYKEEETGAASMPWILKMQAVGIGSLPMLRDPALMLQFKELNPGVAPEGTKIFGAALSGEIVLGNLAACSVLNQLGGRTSFVAADLKDFVVAGVTYGFQVRVKRSHKITYNFKELVKMMHEQTKRGGFFSTSTLNHMVDERTTGSWINFEVDSNDTRFEYSDEYIREVKKEFLDRAIAQIVSIKTGSPVALLALIGPGKNGAATSAEELQKCPHAYCQIGAGVLNVLNSIFGSSKATAELVKSVSGEMVEIVNENKMVQVPGTSVFR